MAARILVVEDDEASRHLLKYLLAARGYAVVEAEDGMVGIRKALSESPDLVLCDLQMPVMNGYQVARYLLADAGWARAPLVAVTAFSMAGDREKALAAGFDDHLTKPIDPVAFVACIERYLPPGLIASGAPLVPPGSPP